VIGGLLRPVFDPAMRAIGGALVRAGITPNAITTAGMLLMIGCGWLIVDGRPVLAGLLLIPVFFLDVIDGAAARVSGKVTVWGGFYDSSCDRISDGVLVSAIAYAVRADPTLLAAALLTGITGGLVPYTRAKAEALGFDAATGPGERADRSILICIGLIFSVLDVTLWLCVAGATFTAIRRMASVRSQAGAARASAT
jgi:phosphatidylglycerophosphate synthase